jgi:hypothetical protein
MISFTVKGKHWLVNCNHANSESLNLYYYKNSTQYNMIRERGQLYTLNFVYLRLFVLTHKQIKT